MEPRPDDIDAVMEAAQALAEAIEASDRHIALRIARRAVENDEDALDIFMNFDAAGRRVREAVARGEEPSMEARIELDRLANEARADSGLRELLRAQADYIELLLAIESTVFRTAPRMGRRLV